MTNDFSLRLSRHSRDGEEDEEGELENWSRLFVFSNPESAPKGRL